MLVSWDFHFITTVSRIDSELSPKEPKEKISSEPLLYNMAIDVLADVSGQSEGADRLEKVKRQHNFTLPMVTARVYIEYF